jgi:hypothetical protein
MDQRLFAIAWYEARDMPNPRLIALIDFEEFRGWGIRLTAGS